MLRTTSILLLILIASSAPAAVFYADPTAVGASNGMSWEDAFNDLQAAVDAASAAGGGEVWAADGTYSADPPSGPTDSFEALDPDAVDILGQEADLFFTRPGGGVSKCHIVCVYTRSDVTRPTPSIHFPATTERDTFASRLSDLLAGRGDLLLSVAHPSVSGYEVSAQDLAAAVNARALHAIEIRDTVGDIAKWDYVLAHLDDQAGGCNKIVWALRPDDMHTLTEVDYVSTGVTMGSIPTLAQDPVYGDRRTAFADMIRRGSFVYLPPNSKCGIPSYSLESSGGTASYMQVSVHLDNIGGAQSANIRFYGCDSATGSTPGTLLFSAPLTLNSDNTVSFHLTSNGRADGQPLTPEQKANIKYIRPTITWLGESSRAAYLMPVRIRSNGDWWNGPDHELVGAQAVIGPSPYPIGGTDTGETVYFNTHCHTTASDGDSSPADMRARYWENYGGLGPDKPRFTIVTDHNRTTPFTIPVGAVAEMKPWVSLYGGFAGWETAREQRNWSANRSVIRGCKGNRCVTADGSDWLFGRNITIDGFTMENGDPAPNYGGGVYAAMTALSLANCMFTSNSAGSGGGLCASMQAPTSIINCVFTGNVSGSYSDGGGAVSCLGSTVTLTGCTLSGNSAQSGGAVSVRATLVVLKESTITSNSASDGAGVHVAAGRMEMAGCSIGANTAAGDGGGLLFIDSSGAFDRCVVQDNIAGRGAGMYSRASTPIVRNSVFSGNRAEGSSGRGGGIYSDGDASGGSYVFNTIAENLAAEGGGICHAGSYATFANNIVAFNAGGIYSHQSHATTRSNDVYGNSTDYAGCEPGLGDISADPLFADRASRDYRLSYGSPCIDAATSALPNLPHQDMEGQYRTWGSGADIGMDEFWPLSGSARQAADGETLFWPQAIVTAAFEGFFYVESDDRAYGIRVDRSEHGMLPGQRADVSGTARTSDDGERYIDAVSVIPHGTGSVKPLLLTNRLIGGAEWRFDPGSASGQEGIAGAFGQNNLGLLISTTGRVTYALSDRFYIDDGCGLLDVSGPIGIRVLPYGQNVPSVGSYVRVTGVSSCYSDGEGLRRLIRATDVVTRQ